MKTHHDITPKDLGAHIRSLRQATGRSSKAAAVDLDIVRTRLWAWEQGDNLGSAVAVLNLLRALDSPLIQNSEQIKGS